MNIQEFSIIRSESGIKIDKDLMIDVLRLRLGPVISEVPDCVTHEGLYDDKPVTIKMIEVDKRTDVSLERKQQFVREVNLFSRLKHPNIAQFIGATMDPALIMVSEHEQDGGTLRSYLWSIRPFRPILRDALTLAFGISRGMQFLHSNGIIHRNLKTSNIFLSEDRRQVKIADFSLFRGGFTTHKVDVYSFAIVLWELLANNSQLASYDPTSGGRPSLDDIPENVRCILKACWASNPAVRPEFMHISAALENIIRCIRPNKNTSWIHVDDDD